MAGFADVLALRKRNRAALAGTIANDIVDRSAKAGIRVQLIGSLPRGDFRLHSDIDLIVLDEVDKDKRLSIEQLVASSIRGSDIPYDLIFSQDLTADKLSELLNDSL